MLGKLNTMMFCASPHALSFRDSLLHRAVCSKPEEEVHKPDIRNTFRPSTEQLRSNFTHTTRTPFE